MAFENLSNKLQEVFKQLRGKGKLTEADVKAAMREVKIALLEADVNFKIVKRFINNVTERAIGSEVMESLTPGQQVIKIVNEELIELMGSTQSKLTFANHPPTVYMMVGLQGSGKTTTSGKIAKLITKKYAKKPLLVAADIYRPAAVDQLKTLGQQLNVPVFEKGTDISAEDIVKQADDALTARELIKGKVLETSPLSARAAAEEISGFTKSEVVQVIGSKFILYRRNEKEPKITLPRIRKAED